MIYKYLLVQPFHDLLSNEDDKFDSSSDRKDKTNFKVILKKNTTILIILYI